jgi:hypothetical protein
MITTDRNNPGLNKVKENGQNESYMVLSEDEIKKGFVRPIRNSYIHVGKIPSYKRIHKILEENDEYFPKYSALMTVIEKEDGSFLGGSYVTPEELDAWQNNKMIGGCGTTTTINSKEIVETYSRNPSFYDSTFCCECGKHLPVGEFVWSGTKERVGS